MSAAVRRNKMEALRRDAEMCVDDAVKAAGFRFDEKQRDVLRTLFANSSNWTDVKPHGLKTREQQALWRGIAGDVARLIERVEGPQGRRLGVETVLRLGVKVRASGYGTSGAPESFHAQYPKARPTTSLGSETPDQEWWSSVRQLLSVLAEVARYEVEALERAKVLATRPQRISLQFSKISTCGQRRITSAAKVKSRRTDCQRLSERSAKTLQRL